MRLVAHLLATATVFAVASGCTNSWEALRDDVPQDTGTQKTYAGPYDQVVEAARAAVAGVPLHIVHDAPMADGNGHMVIGEKPMDMWSYGGWARVIVRPEDTAGTCEVWIATERANVMNVTAVFDYSGVIYPAMEQYLAGAGALPTASP